MKNDIVKAEHVKPIQKKLYKIYLQVIPDACVKIAVLNRESVIGTFKNVYTVGVHWYT